MDVELSLNNWIVGWDESVTSCDLVSCITNTESLVLLGVVQFSVRVSQSFQWKDLGGWVGCKNLSERIVGFQKPVHLKKSEIHDLGGS